MRVEQLNAKALEKVNNDRYLLSVAVAKRVRELNNGDTPLVEVKKNTELTDIALEEIAQGLIKVKVD